MSTESQTILEIYNEAIKKLEALSAQRKVLVEQRKDHIREYIKNLENQKIEAIRESLKLSANNQPEQ
jgi:DNA-binding transcriptional regulator YiaG